MTAAWRLRRYLSGPKSIAFDGAGDLYIADSGNNRIQEVAAASGAQWKNGTMTANDIYTVAGSSSGTSGNSANGTGNTSSLLNDPLGISVNATGMYVADSNNCKVVLFPKTAGTYWNITMTQYEEYAVAGKGPTELRRGDRRRCGDQLGPGRSGRDHGRHQHLHRRLRQQPGPGSRLRRAHRVRRVDGRVRHLRHRGGGGGHARVLR